MGQFPRGGVLAGQPDAWSRPPLPDSRRIGCRMEGFDRAPDRPKRHGQRDIPSWVRLAVDLAVGGGIPFVRPSGGPEGRPGRAWVRSLVHPKACLGPHHPTIPPQSSEEDGSGSAGPALAQAVSLRTRPAAFAALERSSLLIGAAARCPPRRTSGTAIPKNRSPFHRPR